MKKFLLYLGIIGSLPIGGMCSLKQSRLLLGPAWKSTKESLQKIYQPISLKEQCLRAITQNWHVVLKKSTLTADKVFELLEAHDLFEGFEQQSIQVSKSNVLCPEVIARNADVAFYRYHPRHFKQEEQYISDRISSSKIYPSIPMMISPIHWAARPCISDDGTQCIGWSGDSEHEGLVYIDMKSGKGALCIPYSKNRLPGTLHYAFLPNGQLILCDATAFYRVDTPSVLIEHGEKALIPFLARNNSEKFNAFLSCIWGLEALSSTKLICIGLDEKSFGVMQDINSSWRQISIIKTTGNIVGYIVARTRQFLCVVEGDNWEKLHFYDVTTTKEQGSLTVKGLGVDPIAAALSPEEAVVVCGTKYTRGEIDIINCEDLAKPYCMATVKISPQSPIANVVWNPFGLCVEDGHGARHDIHLSPALLHIAAYKKKKREEAQKHTSTLSNNNNA